MCCWPWWVSSGADPSLFHQPHLTCLGSSSRWLWRAFLKWPKWGHLKFKMENSLAWNYTPNPSATWFCNFIPNDSLSNTKITKVCIVIDKPEFREIYDLVICGFKSPFCICSSVREYKQRRVMMATVSDLLKDIKGRKFFKVFLVSLLIKHYVFLSVG